MSFNYLETSYTNIPELKESKIRIDDLFQDFESLDKYLYITIEEWNRDYPLPMLPNSIMVLEFLCNYKFPLYNLPSSIEVLCLFHDYEHYDYPLENLPINLYQLEFLEFNYYCGTLYRHPLNVIPESVKILNLNNTINQSSYNLPIGLKLLEFSSNTFKDETVIYPPELEKLYLRNNSKITSQENLENLENLEKLEKYFNLINLPLSIQTLYLPNLNISNLEIILKRLIHLESLSIANDFNFPILEYPPNLVELHFNGRYKHKLVNLPSTLKSISLGLYYNSLEAVANSNIEHIDLFEHKKLSIINYLPTSLKKLTIIETHIEFHRIKKQYPHITIDKLPDYDYQEAMIDSMDYELWW